MKTTAKQRQMLKTLQHKACMTDDEWREFLGNYGVSSCTELERNQVDEVLEHFERLGLYASGKTLKCRVLGSVKVTDQNEKLVNLTAHLLAELRQPLAYANAMARKIFGIEHIQWLNNKQLFYLNQELIEHKRRIAAKRGQHATN